MAPVKVIIDTDPGIDDVHALLLALAADPEELELLLISVTWGNVSAKSCLRNVVSTFHIIKKEQAWRRQRGRPVGFRSLEHSKPRVAFGAEAPLDGGESKADFFHGVDGLAGIYESHPHLTPQEAWEHLFEEPPAASEITKEAVTVTEGMQASSVAFEPSYRAAHLEILDILASNPVGTVDIVAVGPLTNIALAAAADLPTFLRARRLVVMGGAVDEPGNMTPLAEFNFFADPVAAARVLALTSPVPASTMPNPDPSNLGPYPPVAKIGSRRLQVVLFALDITHQLSIQGANYTAVTDPLMKEGSPLAEWLSHLFLTVLKKHSSLSQKSAAVTLHDPLCVWYVLREAREAEQWKLGEVDDIRVEAVGQWTKGACITDRRDRKKMDEVNFDEDNLADRVGDEGGWLSTKRGNRVQQCIQTPGGDAFTKCFFSTVFNENQANSG